MESVSLDIQSAFRVVVPRECREVRTIFLWISRTDSLKLHWRRGLIALFFGGALVEIVYLGAGSVLHVRVLILFLCFELGNEQVLVSMTVQRFYLLGGALFFFFVYCLVRPGSLRRLAFASGIGFALGYGLPALNNVRKHSFKAINEPIHLLTPPADFRSMYHRIFEHISERYDELGQMEIGEEHITVMQNVFAQIGTLDFDGIRKMWTSVIIPQLRSSISGGALVNDSQNLPTKIEESVVFCDIGSGVGNVCLQILAETHCKKVVGVEVIPSRFRSAKTALANAKLYYPEYFDGKDAIFFNDDFVNCVSCLKEQQVNVVFAHSWMFDDELMAKLTELVTSVPTVLCVVTSRRLTEKVLQISPIKLVSQVYLTADWNEQAPFYVYTKK
ncbi:hypothetical protein TCSYLVIO_005633 [Trypanosoma cruzi]|nr:hypothetical protein TCSYLVIO_005633 [Trypanosoma cruzi]